MLLVAISLYFGFDETFWSLIVRRKTSVANNINADNDVKISSMEKVQELAAFLYLLVESASWKGSTLNQL